MKPPTSEDITRQLQQAHFPQNPGREISSVPIADTPMVVSLEQLRPYELNPRVIRNPLYDDIKASIRERGLDQPPSITRRPNEPHFIIRNGGNTRLSILSELWQETREERFFRIHCLFRPWQSEAHALLGHLAESDLHGQLTFIERALAVAQLQGMLQGSDESLSQRELSLRLSQGGYPISQSQISRMFDTLEYLLPAIPQVLYAGLGKPTIARLISLRRRAESIWNQHFGESLQFVQLWLEVLSMHDGDKPELDAGELQDELLARMSVILKQTPRLLALELHQEHQPSPLQSSTAPRLLQDLPPDAPPQSVVIGDIPKTASEFPSADQDDSDDDTTPIEAPRLPHIRQALSDEPPFDERPDDPECVQVPVDSAPLQPLAEDDLSALRKSCAALAADLATFADASAMVSPHTDGLGFTLTPEHGEQMSARHTGIQLLLSALLRLQDDVSWKERQQLPAALFGQLLIGAYDLPFAERPALTVGLERLPDAQLEQLFMLIRHARQLIELTLSTTR
ncbi:MULTISPECIES: ParB family protein [unclassified Pseudomonas]|uniref:ParB family protein n=1 Tax=unclassified Pseudomonas TaxID=196821 RepID=UPI000B686F40|nr:MULTISPECIES: ParB family protein [unclassified Pseudomonas]SNS90904.1 integrating conjugative element, PFGI_1 class, ParB family protein [Pseudomonas sp. LAMO17WK12:I8]SNY17965.1 integrating conjugative element, PFGI_1 class, ParB family protein [Pseudomonas sp. LAMO17WK12:I12]SNY19727.1 integrating conjugative element, PFGI_1 class, ParB family protein [Pseudomonas sp. LAMO17WK12:I11]SNY19755.1 integrating conjugative element, PFGI_1 class, ParB family protein [Pseudomonas sp. LAMO17WK12:I